MTRNPVVSALESNEDRLEEVIEHTMLSPLQARVILLIQHGYEKNQMTTPLDTTLPAVDNALYFTRSKRRVAENTLRVLNADYEDLHHQTKTS